MAELRLSLTEHAVLGLLAEQPRHGFAIARELATNGSVGRVFSARRPLAYRALDRLVDAGLARPARVEAGDGGPQRVVHRTTPAGRRALDRWLAQPVRHLWELRLEFRLKLLLLERRGASPLDLVRAQHEALRPALDGSHRDADRAAADSVELWRWHSTAAIAAYLDDLEARYAARRPRLRRA